MSVMSGIVCCSCGIEFTVPANWKAKRQEDGSTFWCPNGHSQAYTESTTDILRRERDRLAQQIAYKDDEIARQKSRADHLGRSRAAVRGQVTKLRNRAANGVCPCCNRSFANLRNHMKAKHPDFLEEDADAGA